MLDQAAGLRDLRLTATSSPMVQKPPVSAPTVGSATTITVASGKGGVGKTTLAVNLALALDELAQPVLLWDADLSLANANVMLNLRPAQTVGDLLSGRATIDEVLMPVGQQVMLLPGASGIAALAHVDAAELRLLSTSLTALEQRFRFIIADAASGIGDEVVAPALAADTVLLVITSEPTSLTDAYGFLKVLAQQDYSGVVRVVVNEVSAAADTAAGERLCGTVRRFLRLRTELFGVVPATPWVGESVRRQVPLLRLAPRCPSSRAVRAMAQRLTSDGAAAASPAAGPFVGRLFDSWRRLTA